MKYIILLLTLFITFYSNSQTIFTFHNKTGEFLMFYVYFKDLNRYGSYKDARPEEQIQIPINKEVKYPLDLSITIRNPLLRDFFQIIEVNATTNIFEIIRKEEHRTADGYDWEIK